MRKQPVYLQSCAGSYCPPGDLAQRFRGNTPVFARRGDFIRQIHTRTHLNATSVICPTTLKKLTQYCNPAAVIEFMLLCSGELSILIVDYLAHGERASIGFSGKAVQATRRWTRQPGSDKSEAPVGFWWSSRLSAVLYTIQFHDHRQINPKSRKII
jgi:hypothetical protein